jgi:hypothetical protein
MKRKEKYKSKEKENPDPPSGGRVFVRKKNIILRIYTKRKKTTAGVA